MKIEPGNAPANLTLAGLYWDAGKAQNAADALKAYLSGDPKSEDRIIQVAGFYAGRKKFADAEQQLTEAIKANEKSFKLRFALAEVYRNSGRVDRAVETLNQCLSLSKDEANPDIIKAKNALATISLNRQEISQAMNYTDEVLKASPKNVEAHFTKGTIHLIRGEGTKAVPEFRAVITESPQFIPAYLAMADAHVLNGEMGLALDTLQGALKANPSSREVQSAIGRLYVMRKDYKNAEDFFRKMIAANPEDLQATGRPGGPLRHHQGFQPGGVRVRRDKTENGRKRSWGT